MAINIPTKITNSLDGYLLDAENVKGTYVVVNNYSDLANLPNATIVNGSLAYCQNSYSSYSAGLYQFNGSTWVFANLNKTQATYNDLGEIKLGSATQSSQTIETASSTAGRQYPVQVDSNGRASVNVPWTDTKELFYCTYGTTTFAEITNALSAGKLPYLIRNDKLYFYFTTQVLASVNYHIFSSNNMEGAYYARVAANNNSWGASSISLQNSAQKVTSISASSTDGQYPSAKCVYDNLLLKQDTLTAGTNITIQNNVISAVDNTVLNGLAYREI